MGLPDHPSIVNVLDHLRNAGSKGLRAAFLVEQMDKVQPYPPAIVLLRQLVEAGCVSAVPMPVSTDSTLVLTDEGDAQLAAMKSAGAWICEGVTRAQRSVLTEPRILEFLRAIERGEVTLTPDRESADAIVVAYTASNGWRLAIFNDAGEWDYIEWIEAADERVTFEDIDREMPVVVHYAPSGEIAERAYGIRRSARERAPNEGHAADERAFAELLEVLGGRRRIGLDGMSSKMLRIVLGSGSTDALITRDQFIVHFGVRRQGRPSSYSRRLAPRVLSEVLARASIDAVPKPIVIGLPAGEVPAMRDGFPQWSYEPKLVWIVPAEQSVKIFVRESSERWRAPFVESIPSEGPLALRELPEWTPAQRVYKDVATPIACPECGIASARFRRIGEALVCPACARSFTCMRLG